MLFGPLALVGFGSSIKNVHDAVAGKETSCSLTKSMCQWAILSGVVVLSCAPHQEPRFLFPCMVPLVFLHGRQVIGVDALETNTTFKGRSKLNAGILVVFWVVFNAILYIFFGWLHQGGMLQSLIRSKNLWDIIRERSDAPLPRAVIYYKTYLPATFLTRERPRMKGKDESCEVVSGQCTEEEFPDIGEREVVLDLQSADASVLLKVIRNWLPCNDQYEESSNLSLQLVSPPSVILPLVSKNSDDEWRNYSILSMKDYHGHISTEDWPTFDGSVVKFLEQLKLEVYNVTCGIS